MKELYHIFQWNKSTTTVCSPNHTYTKFPLKWWRFSKRKNNVWRFFIFRASRYISKQLNFTKNFGKLIVSKPKKQFFISLCSAKFYTYSTGLILRALNQPSRSTRRTRVGMKALFSFIGKKFHSFTNTWRWVVVLKTLNNYNIIKSELLKFTVKFTGSTHLCVNIKKNYSNHNYKRISYINKRIRRKYPIE